MTKSTIKNKDFERKLEILLKMGDSSFIQNLIKEIKKKLEQSKEDKS